MIQMSKLCMSYEKAHEEPWAILGIMTAMCWFWCCCCCWCCCCHRYCCCTHLTFSVYVVSPFHQSLVLAMARSWKLIQIRCSFMQRKPSRFLTADSWGWNHSKWTCDFSRSDQPRLSTLALAGDPTIEPPMVQPTTTMFSLHFCAFKK